MNDILVAEDDIELQRLICSILDKNGFSCAGANNGEQALALFSQAPFRMLITDIMMPRMDGYELVKRIKAFDAELPVMYITARDTFADKEKGFFTGADDYMVKPLDINELVLRVRALFRRLGISKDDKLVVGGFVLDPKTYTAEYDRKITELPRKEFLLLNKLLSFPGRIFTKQQLLDDVWGWDSDSDESTVYVHINRLRDKFSDCDDFSIVTLKNLGYKAVTDEKTK